jgi:acylglycerol lipase
MARLYDQDPLIHGTGTLLGLYTMITRGEDLAFHPPVISCPLLIQQGTEDKVTSFKATKEFYEKLPPGNEDREFKGWEGYYHELHNEPETERNVSIKYIADWILARVEQPRARL